LQHSRGGQRPLVLRDPIKRIEGYRISGVGNVEIHDIWDTIRRDLAENALNEVPMRIQEGDAAIGENVLNDECFEERGLSRSCLTDDVHVRSPVGLFDAEDRSPISEGCLGEEGRGFGRIHSRAM